MKILLVNSDMSVRKKKASHSPIRLGYIANTIDRKKHEVRIIDMKFHPTGELRELLNSFRPDVVSIHLGQQITQQSAYSFPYAIEIAKTARKTLPGCTIIGEGPYASILEEGIKKTEFWKYCDLVIYGESDYSFPKVVDALERGKRLEKIDGLILKSGKKTGKAFVKDLGTLPFAACDLFENGRYAYITLLATRGCPYSCIFCCTQKISGPYRKKSPKRVVDEIAYYVKNYGKKEVSFLDDNLTHDRKWLKELCQEMIDRNLKIRWRLTLGARVDEVDPEILKLMKKSGCFRINYGAESGNQKILDRMKKGILIEQIEDAVRWTKEAGISCKLYFTIGNPGDTLETVRDSIKLMLETRPDDAAFFPVVPYPGTGLYNWAKRHAKQINPRENVDYYFGYRLTRIAEPPFETPEFSREERMQALREAFAARQGIVRLGEMLAGTIKYMRDNRREYWKDIPLFFKNWILNRVS